MVNWLYARVETITGAAVILAGASLVSKILGLVRNRILAGTFGAGDTLDAYYAAFRIPDAIFQFVVLGALSAGFIPVFIELMEKHSLRSTGSPSASQCDTYRDSSPPKADQNDTDLHWHIASITLNALLILLTLLTLLFIIFAPQLQALIAPGFSGEKLDTAIRLARIMALGPIFLGVSAVFSGILQSYRRFFIYALSPLLYNVGIIIGAKWLTPVWGVSGLGAGVVLGAFLHMSVQIPTVRAIGFRWQALLDLKNAAVRKIGWLSLPRVLGLAVSQINLFAITLLASKLPSGSLTVFNLANDIQSIPIGLFAVSLATAAFPAFSEFAARHDKIGLQRSFSSTSRLILFLTVPFAVALLLLRAQIVRVLLGWGQFDWSDTIETADTLAFFSLSLFAQALITLLVRALFALKDTLSPLLAGGLGVAVNIILALALRDSFGVAGLALAFSLAMIVNLIALWLMLRLRLGSLDESNIVPALIKISVAALAMATVIQGAKYGLAPFLDMRSGWGIFAQGFISGALGVGTFILVALAVGSDEAKVLKAAFARRLFKSKESQQNAAQGFNAE